MMGEVSEWIGRIFRLLKSDFTLFLLWLFAASVSFYQYTEATGFEAFAVAIMLVNAAHYWRESLNSE